MICFLTMLFKHHDMKIAQLKVHSYKYLLIEIETREFSSSFNCKTQTNRQSDIQENNRDFALVVSVMFLTSYP